MVIMAGGRPLQASDGRPWIRHSIDKSSRGADGVRLADVNHDQFPDEVTGWEEGGVVRVCLSPGKVYDKVIQLWPGVTVGKVNSPEDAVFADLDGDGAVDVVSCCEGETKCVFVHWAPHRPELYLKAKAWKTEPIPASQGLTRWMFALPMQIDGKNGVDLVVAAKNQNALVGWLQSPEHPRDLSQWKLHKLYNAGWIMSLIPADLDGDGDADVIVSDRKEANSGVLWLENPGVAKADGPWAEHRIGANGREVMFLDWADVTGEGRKDVVVAVKPDEIHWFHKPDDPTQPWPSQVIKVELPSGVGTAKGIRVGDIDGDGRSDIVYSCEQATSPKSGVVWLRNDRGPAGMKWTVHDISGPEGVKFDLVQLRDLDGDGDLDVMTCEERDNLGVIWYENPGALALKSGSQPTK